MQHSMQAVSYTSCAGRCNVGRVGTGTLIANLPRVKKVREKKRLPIFLTRLFAPAHFLSGQQGLREPKAYTLLLRLGSQRQAARPFGLGEVEYAVERRALDAGGMRRLRPRLAEGSAGNRLLHCDRQHAPPATRPA